MRDTLIFKYQDYVQNKREKDLTILLVFILNIWYYSIHILISLLLKEREIKIYKL